MPKRYIIPDIHGYLHAFEELLGKIAFSKDDELFLLGDYIDRGKHSRETVDKIQELQSEGYSLFPLRGNHEQMLLNSSDKIEEFAIMGNKRKRPFLNESGRVAPHYIRFFSSLPFFYELEDVILVHAGLNMNIDDPFSDPHEMIWTRNFAKFEHFVPKTVVHGHDPFSIGTIRKAIDEGKRIIPLDNGVYMSHAGFGHLLCLEWYSKELFWVEAAAREGVR